MKSINITIIAVTVILLSSCMRNTEEKEETKSASRNPATVFVSQPVRHEFSAAVEIAGTARPNQQVKVFAMTNGYVQALYADIGDFVNQGKTLAVLRNPELITEKSRLEAELKGKKSVYERLRSVYEKTPQLTTIVDVEKAEAEYESVRAQLDAVQQQILYLDVKAPFTGIVVNRHLDKGAIVQNSLNSPGTTPLLEIQDLQPIRLTIDVPEADAPMVSKGSSVKVTFPELPDADVSASVSRIAYGLNEATRTMKVEIDLPNKDLKIRSGMYAKVWIERSGHKEALSVPNEAVANIKGQSFIYTVTNGVVKKVDVKTGVRDERFTELLSGEIKTTDSVVVKGKEFCHDGAIVNAKASTNN
ncbi:MAG: efflux RND transporter periplasmic adaptor subunit [Bacteroidota bacterium]